MVTIYKLTWGSGDEKGERYFAPARHNDALTRFADLVTKYDRDEKVSAAWVHLERMPDTIMLSGFYLAGWTKTSDERPTAEGCVTLAQAINNPVHS